MKFSLYYNGSSVENFDVEYNRSQLLKKDNFAFNTLIPDDKTHECNELFDLLQQFIDFYYNFSEVKDWSSYNFKSRVVMNDGEHEVEYKNVYPTSMNFGNKVVTVEWCQSTHNGD